MNIKTIKQALEKARRAHDEVIDELPKAALDSLDGVINELQEVVAEAEKQEPAVYIPADALRQITPPLLILRGVSLYGYRGDGLTPLYTHSQPKREHVQFPTMLRRMWSGGDVQAWLDANVNCIEGTT